MAQWIRTGTEKLEDTTLRVQSPPGPGGKKINRKMTLGFMTQVGPPPLECKEGKWAETLDRRGDTSDDQTILPVDCSLKKSFLSLHCGALAPTVQ